MKKPNDDMKSERFYSTATLMLILATILFGIAVALGLFGCASPRYGTIQNYHSVGYGPGGYSIPHGKQCNGKNFKKR